MDTTIRTIEVNLPEVDLAKLEEVVKKFGWSIGKKKKKSGIQKGLDDIAAGRVYRAKDMDDLKRHLLG